MPATEPAAANAPRARAAGKGAAGKGATGERAAPVRVRFAPSPTGALHVGNLRTALINWLFARKTGGAFILRFDDTDTARSSREYADAIAADLRWACLDVDRTERQSARTHIYDAAAEELKAQGLLYPAYETAGELERKRKRQLQRGEPPVYDRAALRLSASERAQLEAEGRRPHWRFKLSGARVAWNDAIRGPQEIDTASLSDPVLIREDGSYTYMLPSAADDAEMGITHVIRGEDHVANTAAQIELMRALGASPPQFAHHPLLVGAGGAKLSKRAGGASVAQLRAAGIEPEALVSYLARLGTADPIEMASLEELIAGFDFARFGRAPARYDMDELARLNREFLHTAPFEAVAGRLARLDGAPAVTPELWQAVRANIDRLAEAADWARIVARPIEPVIEDADLCHAAAQMLPPEPWDETTWKAWTQAVGGATGRKGRALYMPLRKALTGRASGPELARLLPLIGRDRAMARLQGARA